MLSIVPSLSGASTLVVFEGHAFPSLEGLAGGYCSENCALFQPTLHASQRTSVSVKYHMDGKWLELSQSFSKNWVFSFPSSTPFLA